MIGLGNHYEYHVGIDLGCSAVSAKASSAVAVLNAGGALVEPPHHFRRSSELIGYMSRFPRDRIIVAVDAPRSVPDHTAENYARRSCETMLQAATGEHVGSFAGVASLFVRWYEIESMHLADVKVIETYPRAVWARLGIPHKPKDYKQHAGAICASVAGITGIDCSGFTNHQLDAVLCAYTARCYSAGEAEAFGKAGEGLMFIPSRDGVATPQADAEEDVAVPFRSFPSQVDVWLERRNSGTVA